MMNKKTIDSEQIEEAKEIAIEKLIQLNDEFGYYRYNSDEQRKLEALVEGAIEMGAGIANEPSEDARGESELKRLLGTRKEIKFRAWDYEHEIMTYSPVNKINFAGQIHLHKGWEDLENTCYILMQFTGYKDRKNNEIYIGDWFKHHLGGIGVIVQFGNKLGIASGQPGNYHATDSINKHELRSGEGIGNIFERPNLLDECT